MKFQVRKVFGTYYVYDTEDTEYDTRIPTGRGGRWAVCETEEQANIIAELLNQREGMKP